MSKTAIALLLLAMLWATTQTAKDEIPKPAGKP
jgi:hypothetical protein